MWECGLKLILWSSLANLVSHSLCGSVDWNLSGKAVLLMTPVTPYVGVWIETVNSRHNAERNGSHSLCGSVDWNLKGVNEIYNLLGHSLCGSVDWNNTQGGSLGRTVSHSLCGSVDWNFARWGLHGCDGCHSLCGSVDWNRIGICKLIDTDVTPYVGVWIET